jgi:Exodeoxyribonuclease V, gamma subunit
MSGQDLRCVVGIDNLEPGPERGALQLSHQSDSLQRFVNTLYELTHDRQLRRGNSKRSISIPVDFCQIACKANGKGLREEIGTPSLAERMADACAAVHSDPEIVDLPERLSVFSASRLPADHLQILSALGDKREVHLWLADASPALWRDLGHDDSTRRREDTSAACPGSASPAGESETAANL